MCIRDRIKLFDNIPGELTYPEIQPLLFEYIQGWLNLQNSPNELWDCLLYTSGFTDMIPGLIIFIFGCNAVGFQLTFLNLIKIITVVFGATLLRGGIYTIIGSLAFWLKRTNKLISVALQLFDYSTKYPISIYPVVLQSILTFLIPIGFICFYPASEFLGVDTTFRIPGNLCLWTLGVGVLVYILGIVTYTLGIKSYESSGS